MKSMISVQFLGKKKYSEDYLRDWEFFEHLSWFDVPINYITEKGELLSTNFKNFMADKKMAMVVNTASGDSGHYQTQMKQLAEL